MTYLLSFFVVSWIRLVYAWRYNIFNMWIGYIYIYHVLPHCFFTKLPNSSLIASPAKKVSSKHITATIYIRTPKEISSNLKIVKKYTPWNEQPTSFKKPANSQKKMVIVEPLIFSGFFLLLVSGRCAGCCDDFCVSLQNITQRVGGWSLPSFFQPLLAHVFFESTIPPKGTCSKPGF